MNDDDPTTNDKGESVPEPEGPIKPEVVGRMVRGAGARPAGRSRRAAQPRGRAAEPDSGVDDGAVAPTGRPLRPQRPMRFGGYRIAALVLMFIGLFLGGNVLRFATSPASVRCSLARAQITTAIKDVNDDTPDAVRTAVGDLTEEQVKDDANFSCGDAIQAAEAINGAKGDQKLLEESYIKNIGVIGVIVGAIQLVAGFVAFRWPHLGSRRLALVSAVLGAVAWSIFLGPVFSLLGHALVSYGLFFSRGAKEIFGEPGGLFARRRRPAAAAAADATDS